MTAARISINQQLEAVTFACTRQHGLAEGRTVRPGMGTNGEKYELLRLQAACRTIQWFQQHEAFIREWMKLPGYFRRIVLDAAEGGHRPGMKMVGIDGDARRHLDDAIAEVFAQARWEKAEDAAS